MADGMLHFKKAILFSSTTTLSLTINFSTAHQKLESKYYGPYLIEERVGVVAYKLKLPDSVRLHPVFHVSLLRKKLGDGSVISSEFLPLSNEGTLVIEPEAILDTRWVKRRAKFSEESLVKWRMLAMEDATWESIEELLQQFPNWNLKDKRPLGEGSNDKTLNGQRRSQCAIKRNPKYHA